MLPGAGSRWRRCSLRRLSAHAAGSNRSPTNPAKGRLNDYDHTARNGRSAGVDGFVVTELSELPSPSLLDESALAKILRVTPRTVRRMVTRYEIPPGVKLGNRKVWIADDVLAYLRQRAQRVAEDSRSRDLEIRRNSP